MSDLKQKLEALSEKIIQWTIKNVSEVEFEEPAFALCVAYSMAGEYFPSPSIALGLESERLKMAANPKMKERIKYSNHAYFSFYNPAHFKNFDTSELYKDREELDALGNSLFANKDVDWDDFYFNLSVKLAEIEWNNYLKITPDFVSYTTDVEDSQWEKNFMASVSQTTRQKLYEGGWLPKSMTQ